MPDPSAPWCSLLQCSCSRLGTDTLSAAACVLYTQHKQAVLVLVNTQYRMIFSTSYALVATYSAICTFVDLL